MSDSNRPILYGSIIHLRNVLPNGKDGGYLDTGISVVKDIVKGRKNDPRIRTYVSTNVSANRPNGSGNWKVLSADGKHNGEQLLFGDNIYLHNINQNAGFLDTNEHIFNLQDLNQYYGPMKQGVFTFSIRNRGGGVTSIWTVESADAKVNGTQIFTDDSIYLGNGYTGAGYLYTHNKVSGNPAFSDQEGLFFVFASNETGDSPSENTDEYGSRKWQISLSQLGNTHLYNVYDLEVLRGRNNNMQVVTTVTDVLLQDTFRSLRVATGESGETTEAGVTIETVEQLVADTAINYDKKHLQTLLNLQLATLDPDATTSFQIKQLLNLYKLSEILKSFDEHTLQALMKASLKKHEEKWTFPPLHLFRSCFRHTATDYEIIQRATTQRRWRTEEKTSSMSEHGEELLVMDKLATKAIAPFGPLLLHSPEQLVVITYFSDVTHIHHTPYTDNFILVGVSYDRVPPASSSVGGAPENSNGANDKNISAFEMMAIPHEVGHYIYENGELADGTLVKELSEQFKDNVYYPWCEEIFADLYGCIVAGPLAAISIQALLMSTDQDRALKDDEHHPTPMLRPYLMSEMLRVLSQLQWGEIEPQWDNIKSQWGDFTSGQQREKVRNDFKTIVERYGFGKKNSNVTKMLDDTWTITLDSWGYGKVQNDSWSNATRIYLPDESALQVETIVNVDRVISSIRPIIKEFAKQLVQTLSLIGVDPSEEESSIPLSRKNDIRTDSYYDEMANMIRDIAKGDASCPLLLNLEVDKTEPDKSEPDRSLQRFLDGWGDSGPHTIGGH